MSYSMHVSVLVHDTDARHIARPSAVWRWMQEAANRQMRSEGPSYDELMERGLSFLLSRMCVDFVRPIMQYEELTVETFALPSRGYSFERGYKVIDETGKTVAAGQSVWALYDLNAGRLARVEALGSGYSGGEAPAVSAPIRFLIPDSVKLSPVGERKIFWSDVDVNRHMNNTGYANLLYDFLPDPAAGQLIGASINYRHEAKLGETLTVLSGEETTPEGIRRVWFRTLVGDEINVEAMMDFRP